MGKITTHLNLIQCQKALGILRSKATRKVQFSKLKAAKLTNTVSECPSGEHYFRAMEKRLARRIGETPKKGK